MSADRTHAPHYQLGFTLVEALIALLVLAVGLLGLAQLQGHAMESSAAAKARTTAINLAQQKLEELRAKASYAYPAMTGGSDSAGPLPGSHTGFSRSWSVTEDTALRYKTITVVANWVDTSGRSQSIALKSMVAEPSPEAPH